MTSRNSGFTLLELLAASLAAAMVILAVYGIFHRTVKTRDNAVLRIREARKRERAGNIIRNDLRNAYISGGTLANAMEGGLQNQKSRFPGYLRFTTTTGRNKSEETYGDVQQIEYYLSDTVVTGTSTPTDDASTGTETGTLIRAVTRDLLSTDQTDIATEEPLLPRVQKMEVAFYDGQDWQESWAYTGTDSSQPQAVRIRIQQTAASDRLTTPPLLEIIAPITTEPPITASSTTASTSTPTATPTPTPTVTPTPTPATTGTSK